MDIACVTYTKGGAHMKSLKKLVAVPIVLAFVFLVLLCIQPFCGLMVPVEYAAARTDAQVYSGEDVSVSVGRVNGFVVYVTVSNDTDSAIYISGTSVQKLVDGQWRDMRSTNPNPSDMSTTSSELTMLAPGESTQLLVPSRESLGLFAIGKFRAVVSFGQGNYEGFVLGEIIPDEKLFYVSDEF